jgi:LysM repeat protein
MKIIKTVCQLSLIMVVVNGGIQGCAQTAKRADTSNTITYPSPAYPYPPDAYVSPYDPVPNPFRTPPKSKKPKKAKAKAAPKSSYCLPCSPKKRASSVSSGSYITHTVARGENLYRISLRYGVSQAAIKSANGLSSSALKVGQKLRIPGGKVSTIPKAPVAKAPTTRTATTAKRTVTNTLVKTIVSTKNPASCSPAPQWGWPSQGTVTPTTSSFNQGVAIAISGGGAQLLKAAAAGTITFAGQGTSKRPNRITISHNRTFSTVYEYYGKSLAKIGSQVSLGQTIGELNSQTALHFEIRCYKKALNPLSYLPS